MRKILLGVFVMMIVGVSFVVGENSMQVSSPNGNIQVTFSLSGDQAHYSVTVQGKEVIAPSQMGVIREDANFADSLKLLSTSETEPVEDHYTLVHGKQREISYHANRKIFHLENANGEKMDVVFQVSGDGVAFKYFFPERSDIVKRITQEISEFHFAAGAKAWIQPLAAAKSGWCSTNPSYEEYYIQGVPLEEIERNEPGWVFPALFHTEDTWVLISETAPDRDYCGCRLQQIDGTRTFFVDFPQPPEIFPGGTLKPESTLPWETPWRIITLGSLKTVTESTLGTDLARPSVIEDISWIKPGRSSWSWVLLKDDSTITNVQKRFIDYAADMGWEYCLIDAFWDDKIGDEGIKDLAKYAADLGVGICLWYNSSGDWNETVLSPKSRLLTHDMRVREFSKIKEWGIKGVKVDFFGGDGQSMIAYYQDIFEDAAAFHLVVNCHGATIPRGWQRTYPNLVSMESVRGFEYVTFDQANTDKEPIHCCMQPFTRNVFDPMDFTPVCFSEVPEKQRQTTNAFELALAVLFQSGIQHYAEIPQGMAKVPEFVQTIMKQISNTWEDTRYITGFPGKDVVLARRSKDAWYVAGINGEAEDKTLTLDLSELPVQHGILITDGADNRAFIREEIEIHPKELYPILIKPNGGFVMRFEDIR